MGFFYRGIFCLAWGMAACPALASAVVVGANESPGSGVAAPTMAVSANGLYIAKVTEQPNTLVLMDARSNILKVLPLIDKNGKIRSRVAVLRDAPPRKSFVVALKDVPEVWEVSYDPTAEDIAVGMVHDFQYKEGAFIRGYLNPRRTYLPEPLQDFSFTQNFSELVATTQTAGKRALVNLDVRRKIADLDEAAVLPAMATPR